MEGEAHTDTNTDVHVTPIPLLCFQLARLRGLSAPLAVQAQQLHATNAPLERQLAAIEAACHAIGSEAPGRRVQSYGFIRPLKSLIRVRF